MAIRGIETVANALPAPLEGLVDTSTKADPDAVYQALADLQRHLDWAGKRAPANMRLLTMDAPVGLATAGIEFTTTGSGPTGMLADRSVVTEATPGRVFEFVTEAALTPKRGGTPVELTIVHRYEIAAADGGSRLSYRFRITRISHLIGSMRLLRTPLAVVVTSTWRAVARRALRNLVRVAEARG